MRHAIIDKAAGQVVNIIEYSSEITGQPPGHDKGLLAVASGVAQIGWGWDGKAFVPPPAPAPDWVSLAKAGLAESDRVAIRCAKAGVPYPADWQAYDAALRPIAKGSADGPLPTRPEYPAGT